MLLKDLPGRSGVFELGNGGFDAHDRLLKGWKPHLEHISTAPDVLHMRKAEFQQDGSTMVPLKELQNMA
jgi:hypothetical protein